MTRFQILELVAEMSVECSYYGLVLTVFNRHPRYLLKLEKMHLNPPQVIEMINKGF